MLIFTFCRKDYDLTSIRSLEHFTRLEDQGKRFVQLLVEGQEVFGQGLERHAVITQTFHQATETNLKRHFDQGQAEIIQAVTKKQRQEESQDSKRRENAILQHLSYPTMKVRYENIDQAHARTFNWIFDSSMRSTRYKFSEWLEGSDEKLYWINGKPGSGKSTLMRYIVEDARTKKKLQKWAGERGLNIASYFFWISGNPDQCSHTGLLRALLHDLLKKHRDLIKQIFPDLWEELENPNVPVKLRAWTVSYASEALNNLLGKNIGKVALFIDGLDEYNGEYNDLSSPEKYEKDYKKIINQIQSLNSLDHGDLKICFSSRPYQVFHRYFDRQPKLSLQDLTYDDIYKYTQDKLQSGTADFDSPSLSDREISDLVSQIARQAEGIFLWVHLVVKSLLHGIDNSDNFEVLESRLKRVPSSLMGLYRHLLEHIEPQYLEEASRIFAIVEVSLSQANMYIDEFEEESGAILTLLDLFFALEYSRLKSCFGRFPNLLPECDDLDTAAEQMNVRLRTRCMGLIGIEHVDEDEDEDEEYEHYHADEVGDEVEQRKQTIVTQSSNIRYIHRSVKEFLDLEETRSFFKRATDNECDLEVSLIWSAVQMISIFEKLDSHEDRTFYLVNQALLYSVSLLREGKPSPSCLLDILDDTMQLKHSQQELPWANKAMYSLNLYIPRRYDWQSGGGRHNMTQKYGMFLRDDFLSLAINYGLTNYVELKIAKQPSRIKKLGRPYLDYALTKTKPIYDESLPHRRVDPKMVWILLQAGADLTEHCPTRYSYWAYEISDDGPIEEFHFTNWTPWKSALESVLGQYDAYDYMAPLDQQELRPLQSWLTVLKLLLDKAPDVNAKIWPHDHHHHPYTVSEIIGHVFGFRYPQDTGRLLARVEELAHAQKCPIYKRRLPAELMDRLRKTLVPHLEMTEAQEAYWCSEDKPLL